MTRKKTPSTIEPDFTLAEACRVLNIGPTKCDELIAAGVLESYKLSASRRGGRRITRESVEALRTGRPDRGSQAEDTVRCTASRPRR